MTYPDGGIRGQECPRPTDFVLAAGPGGLAGGLASGHEEWSFAAPLPGAAAVRHHSNCRTSLTNAVIEKWQGSTCPSVTSAAIDAGPPPR